MKSLAILFLACVSIATTQAQLTATLSASIQNSAAGQSLVFSGSLANTGTANLYLNNVTYSVPGGMTSGSNAFYANVPGILTPGESYIGPIFGVVLSSSAAPADYAGSVVIQGGTNIFDATILASPSFTVLSPAVSIVATTEIASEFGPVPGAFTVTRTGGTGIPLPISLSILGSASNGVDYQTISASTVIATGSLSVVIPIVPILQDTALGARVASIYIPPSTLFDPGSPVFASVAILDTPFNSWRLQNFGANANSPQTYPSAEWAQSGIPNIFAYALNINPQSPAETLLPSVSVVSNYLTLTYIPNAGATDVTFSVQASTDLINWSSANVQPTSTQIPNALAFRYFNPVNPENPSVFLRLQVTPLDWQ
jgi:hypothetical protein